MSVQKKSLISSRTSQTKVGKPAEGSTAIGEPKSLQAKALLRHTFKARPMRFMKKKSAKK
jgi:hypothetical protein